jgi:hypothetical protein
VCRTMDERPSYGPALSKDDARSSTSSAASDHQTFVHPGRAPCGFPLIECGLPLIEGGRSRTYETCSRKEWCDDGAAYLIISPKPKARQRMEFHRSLAHQV